MGWPDDIPLDAILSAQEHMFGFTDASLVTPDVVRCARAILAERERCAAVAESRHKVWGTPDQIEGIEVEDDISACEEIAAAIRGGSNV